jgi:hypothetical protein
MRSLGIRQRGKAGGGAPYCGYRSVVHIASQVPTERIRVLGGNHLENFCVDGDARKAANVFP